MTRPARRRVLLALLAVAAAAGCDADKHCGSSGDCDGDQQACRPDVIRCPGTGNLVVLGTGHCRYFGSTCSSDLDCVPEETCASDGVCRPSAPQCTQEPACPSGCPFQQPFPCACVCSACPAVPDGGA